MSADPAFWSARYAAAEGHLFGDAPNAFLARHAQLLQPGWRVLVPADGDGRNGIWLAEQGLDVVSTDFCPVAQAEARRWAAERGVAPCFELGDLTEYAWPEAAFDAIVVIFAQFLTPPERDTAFAGIARSLRPGGLLLMQGYRPEQLAYGTGGPKAAENLYTEAMLRGAFAGFGRVEIAHYDAVLEEGTGHHGMSALIDLIGWR
jgi:SAM-dependent methyltransferase